MAKEENKKNWFRRGVVLGTVAATIYILSNKKCRTKIVDSVSDCKEQTKHWVTVIKENREPFMQQIKESGDKISRVVEDASEDIQTLVETSKHMKEHTQSLLRALQETKDEFESLSSRLKSNQLIESSATELLSTSDEDDIVGKQ
ncbi:hypothetical protein QA612_01345 [Evansella sp. AB-P1]|uniref:hypothetical protein n=1 Tax=Evansella sp. AB-P1 TaxID=3037653 RepID=UPI00241FC096|nr:hypothetical protein [Evansella sp. AB-P1]MDG5786117.1 hypothetical protein [Evansella sp. AB-P1]